MYGSHKKHSAGARNVKARAKRALLLPSLQYGKSTLTFQDGDEMENNVFCCGMIINNFFVSV